MNTPIALFGLVTALSGCAMEGLEAADTSTSESSITVSGWLDDLHAGTMASSYQVGLSSYGGVLHMLYTPSGSHQLRASAFDGDGWAYSSTTALQADYGPALTTWNNQLVTVYHSASQNRLLMATSTNGTTWSAPVSAGAALGSASLEYAPAAAMMNSQLFIAYCIHDATGDHVRLDRKLSTSWDTRQHYDIEGTCKHVALGLSTTGELRLLITAQTADTWFMHDVRLTGDAGTSYGPYLLSFKSKKPPSVVACDGVTHMVHGGYSTPGEIWWTYLRSDGSWAPDARVPDQASDGGAALGCDQGRPIMVHDGGYDQLWWSEYVP